MVRIGRAVLGWMLALAIGVPSAIAFPQSPDAFAGVPRALQPFVDRHDISGAVMLVATKDRVLHRSAVGTSDVASGRHMTTSDVFWIASMSKPITAVAVALLVDDGKLSFDDPVQKYVPEFRDLWVVGEQSAQRRVLEPARRQSRCAIC